MCQNDIFRSKNAKNERMKHCVENMFIFFGNILGTHGVGGETHGEHNWEHRGQHDIGET
jgi:hypothetical protein